MPTEDTADKTAQPTTTAGERFTEAARETQRLLDQYVETFATMNSNFATSLGRMSEASADMLREAAKEGLLVAMGAGLRFDASDVEAGS